jgi:hypothetical protein
VLSELRGGWVVTNTPERIAELLASPTIGACLRRQGTSPERRIRTVRWLLACRMVTEFQRMTCAEELAGIMRFVDAGASPVAIASRLRRLAHRLDPSPHDPEQGPYSGGPGVVVGLLADAACRAAEGAA